MARITNHSAVRTWSNAGLGLAVMLLVGCGGGGASAPTTGRVTVSVAWPGRSRVIPAAANSMQVTLLRGGSSVAGELLARPAGGGVSSVTFDDITPGTITVSSSAYPNADGTGVCQATGSQQTVVVAGATEVVAVAMDSTVHHLELSDTNFAVVGQAITLSVTARDDAGRMVLLWPGRLTWATDPGGVVTVDSAGACVGLTAGTTRVTVTDGDSGRSAALDLDSLSAVLKYHSGNAHWYLGVSLPTLITWEAARDAAAGLRLNGVAGHLVAVTSADESNFINAGFASDNRLSYFMGGYQDTLAPDFAEPAGGWRWVTGEPWGYTDWRTGEPNDRSGRDNCMNKFPDGHWNDCPNDDGHGYGYIVEFEP